MEVLLKEEIGRESQGIMVDGLAQRIDMLKPLLMVLKDSYTHIYHMIMANVSFHLMEKMLEHITQEDQDVYLLCSMLHLILIMENIL